MYWGEIFVDRYLMLSELKQMNSADGLPLIGPKDIKSIQLLPDYNLEYIDMPKHILQKMIKK